MPGVISRTFGKPELVMYDFVRIVRLGASRRLEINFTDDTALLLGDYPTEDEAIAKLKELFAIIVHKEIADSMDAKIKPPQL